MLLLNPFGIVIQSLEYDLDLSLVIFFHNESDEYDGATSGVRSSCNSGTI